MANTRFRKCAGPPALLGWATGNLPEPKNNPQGGHGEHAHRDARAAKGQAGEAGRRRLELRERSRSRNNCAKPKS